MQTGIKSLLPRRGHRRSRKPALLALVGLSAGLFSAGTPVSAFPGDVDAGFGQGGKVETVVGDGSKGNAVAAFPDGRVVVAGAAIDAQGVEQSVLLVRYLATGVVDTGFGAQGSVTTAVGSARSAGRSVSVTSDGRIVVAGDYVVSGGDSGVFVARYLPDGSLDGTFAVGGIWRSPMGAYGDSLQSVAVNPGGGVVAAGFATGGPQCSPQTTGWCYPDVLLVRLTAAGVPDPAFGGGDGIVVDSIGAFDDEAHAVVIDPTGRIVMTGTTRASGSEIDLAVARYLSDGSLDATFAQAGHGRYLPGGFADGRSLTLQPDGRILVGGAVSGGALVTRLQSNGELDPSWDGQIITNGNVKAISVRPDGRVLAAATSWFYSFLLMRYTADGYADPTFASDHDGLVGVQFHPYDPLYGMELVGGMVVQADGAVVLAGQANWYDGPTYRHSVALARFLQETPPGAPVSAAAGAGDGQVTVTWDAPTDSGGSPIVRYDISIAGGGPVGTVSGDSRSLVVTGLTNGTPYRFTIVAANSLGPGMGVTTIAATPQAAPQPPPPPARRSGYWMLSGSGTVYAFGDAVAYDNAGRAGAVDLEPTPTGSGYWLLTDDGSVFAKGDARAVGRSIMVAGEKAVSLSATPDGGGYWIFTDKGRVIACGNAPFKRDLSGHRLNAPVLDSVATPSGQGYWMVAADGGIFSFGDAGFFGSMGATKLNKPVMSMAPDPDGTGYWLVASDGGIFAFDAPFYGSMGQTKLNKPVTGMVPGRAGYLMVAEDGGIFAFGDVAFHGSLGTNPPASPIQAVALLP